LGKKSLKSDFIEVNCTSDNREKGMRELDANCRKKESIKKCFMQWMNVSGRGGNSMQLSQNNRKIGAIMNRAEGQ